MKHSFRLLFAAMAAIVIILASCEDSISPDVKEGVRLAALPDRVLIIQSSPNGVVPSSGTRTIKDGEAFSLSSQANPGFTFYHWEKVSGSGAVAFADANAQNTTITLTGGDATIRAVIDDTSFVVTVIDDGHGTTNFSSLSLTKDIPSAGLTATPSAGYAFDNWTITAGSGITFAPNAATASVTVTAGAGDATVKANFRDSQAPSGTVAIQGKQTVDGTLYNKLRAVTVNLTCADNSGNVASMKLSESSFAAGTTTGWIAAGLSTTFTFASDGAKTLYVRFKDAAGNESLAYTDTTFVDSTGPVPTRNQVELTGSPGTYPLYVSTYNTNLQLNYLAGDAGCGVQKVYFSNTSVRPAVAQVTSYPSTPVPYPWTLASSAQGYYNVYFWFEDKLGNISGPFIEPVRYDDKYEGNSGNNDIDATSGATIILDDTVASFPFNKSLTTYYTPTWGNPYLVDSDCYKWGFNPLDAAYDYPVTIVLYVNNGATTYAQMPKVAFYDHNGDPVSYTYTYPYLNNAQVRYTLTMPYISTVQ
jgi:hypothetical protein